jgi:hypothetical protein
LSLGLVCIDRQTSIAIFAGNSSINAKSQPPRHKDFNHG